MVPKIETSNSTKATMIRQPSSHSDFGGSYGVYGAADEESYSQESLAEKGEQTETTAWSSSSRKSKIGARNNVPRTFSRCAILLTLVCATVGTSLLVARFSREADEQAVEEFFEGYALDMRHISEQRMRQAFSAISGLSTTITSFALSDDTQQFPLFSLSHFEQQTKEPRILSDAEMIAFVPAVMAKDVAEWIAFSGTDDSVLQSHSKVTSLNGLCPSGMIAPVWQTSPWLSASIANLDLMTTVLSESLCKAYATRKAFLSRTVDTSFLTGLLEPDHPESPRSVFIQPVLSNFEDSEVVGFVLAVLPWEAHFENRFQDTARSVSVVLDDGQGEVFTFELVGPHARFVGEGDLHDMEYHAMRQVIVLDVPLTEADDTENESYSMTLYPTKRFILAYEVEHHTNSLTVYASAVVGIFLLTAIVFFMYDRVVTRGQLRLLSAAEKSKALVASLFPKTVHDRMFQEDNPIDASDHATYSARGNKTMLKSFLHGNEIEGNSRPIADLFPDCTVMFADIVGFTAWSSMREPTQVFMLLERIFATFDEIADKRRVFKVETVGDCYVAVTGVPEPRKDHVLAMCRFADEALHRFSVVVKQLEVELGPDTGDLGMRFGLHTGPVTAGVLRGKKARFQLFGDTMNTTARIESTGARNRIHVSQEVADHVAAAGKSHWLHLRSEKIFAKGKGEMQTYWLNVIGSSERSGSNYEASEADGVGSCSASLLEQFDLESDHLDRVNEKMHRLVDWNTEILLKLLKQAIARREALGSQPSSPAEIRAAEQISISLSRNGNTVLDEVKESISLPTHRFDPQMIDIDSVELSDDVVVQLRDFVYTIMAMYRNNPFHNFEHASHVTMSVVKLLSRIVTPDIESFEDDNMDQQMHDHTYGINSDPLTHFAVVLSALIHDLDHPGVPNSTLISEKSDLAAVYKNQSIAEQNSIDLAFDLLLHDRYIDLREALYINVSQVRRFRQLVVNSVMATDIMDKELKALRNARWDEAFSEQAATAVEDITKITNRKATIVIEHLMQASDVAHTMQHWQIYRKWNERLFAEMYTAYRQGRAEKNPAEGWYEGELGFFDYYIIPLAKKLKSCGIFGVSSDEYLNYAMQNRKAWEARGREVVARSIQKYEQRARRASSAS